mmetsp:Transcript_27647/g.61053  ORF Transcript_27647/g.61053 Transcript_27647/m.61053 type:complete len:315 (-) Transcript_27647:2117-3061(-)
MKESHRGNTDGEHRSRRDINQAAERDWAATPTSAKLRQRETIHHLPSVANLAIKQRSPKDYAAQSMGGHSDFCSFRHQPNDKRDAVHDSDYAAREGSQKLEHRFQGPTNKNPNTQQHPSREAFEALLLHPARCSDCFASNLPDIDDQQKGIEAKINRKQQFMDLLHNAEHPVTSQTPHEILHHVIHILVLPTRKSEGRIGNIGHKEMGLLDPCIHNWVGVLHTSNCGIIVASHIYHQSQLCHSEFLDVHRRGPFTSLNVLRHPQQFLMIPARMIFLRYLNLKRIACFTIVSNSQSFHHTNNVLQKRNNAGFIDV